MRAVASAKDFALTVLMTGWSNSLDMIPPSIPGAPLVPVAASQYAWRLKFNDEVLDSNRHGRKAKGLILSPQGQISLSVSYIA